MFCVSCVARHRAVLPADASLVLVNDDRALVMSFSRSVLSARQVDRDFERCLKLNRCLFDAATPLRRRTDSSVSWTAREIESREKIHAKAIQSFPFTRSYARWLCIVFDQLVETVRLARRSGEIENLRIRIDTNTAKENAHFAFCARLDGVWRKEQAHAGAESA